MALYMLKEVNPSTGKIFQDDDTTTYYPDDEHNGDAYSAATNGYNLRVAQDDANWGEGEGEKRWTLLKVG